MKLKMIVATLATTLIAGTALADGFVERAAQYDIQHGVDRGLFQSRSFYLDAAAEPEHIYPIHDAEHIYPIYDEEIGKGASVAAVAAAVTKAAEIAEFRQAAIEAAKPSLVCKMTVVSGLFNPLTSQMTAVTLASAGGVKPACNDMLEAIGVYVTDSNKIPVETQ